MKKTIATVIGIGLLLLLGCAKGAPAGVTLATSVDDVVGVWHLTWRPFQQGQWWEVYIQFKGDGTFGLAYGDWVEEKPEGEGEFWFEGTRFYWKDIVAPSRWDYWQEAFSWTECLDSNPIAIYEVQLLANGSLKFLWIEKDECFFRVHILHDKVWEPVR